MSAADSMDVDDPTKEPSTTMKWSDFMEQFFQEAGLTRTLRGLREDLLVMSSTFEAKTVPYALKNLQINLLDSLVRLPADTLVFQNGDEVAVKTAHMKNLNGNECVAKGETIKEVSQYIAENRARITRSNKHEFLYSFQEKKQILFPDKKLSPEEEERLLTTCARTDAKPQNRDVQIKFDIAKNEHGPLLRTMQSPTRKDTPVARQTAVSTITSGEPTITRHPGLAERFHNLEDHLAIKYVPAPPHSLLERMRFIEDHIMNLEREYPPWAALHFRQPKGGWPPPPPESTVIVPTHLTTSTRPDTAESSTQHHAMGQPGPSGSSAMRKNTSSLQRAVLDKLDVKRAMDDRSHASGSRAA